MFLLIFGLREDMQIAAEANYADMEAETNEIVYDTIVHGGKSPTAVSSPFREN